MLSRIATVLIVLTLSGCVVVRSNGPATVNIQGNQRDTEALADVGGAMEQNAGKSVPVDVGRGAGIAAGPAANVAGIATPAEADGSIVFEELEDDAETVPVE